MHIYTGFKIKWNHHKQILVSVKNFTSKIENSLAVFTIYYIYDLKGTLYKMMSQNVRQILHQNSTTVRDSPS
jgi:hypothetical protein